MMSVGCQKPQVFDIRILHQYRWHSTVRVYCETVHRERKTGGFVEVVVAWKTGWHVGGKPEEPMAVMSAPVSATLASAENGRVEQEMAASTAFRLLPRDTGLK